MRRELILEKVAERFLRKRIKNSPTARVDIHGSDVRVVARFDLSMLYYDENGAVRGATRKQERAFENIAIGLAYRLHKTIVAASISARTIQVKKAVGKWGHEEELLVSLETYLNEDITSKMSEFCEDVN